ncbi:unnamed protein product [Ostreobium quekettii]|uniref:NAD(P)H oxidase (H(2)O(2)-forming) n=1 Tax=Ostreobium quekettii TaxID=121088 RepID=A0A8S1J2T9_9CHLO|nr:unnamed protein product [Ostreobium quekettii]|eukprot:evm.model.scf_318.15 EVM.evm.TU.scf_318.15   scf_318:89935-94024(+)
MAELYAQSRADLEGGMRSLFNKLTGGSDRMDFQQFLKMTNTRSRFYAERLFDAIDVDHSKDISFEEFLNAIHTLQTRDSSKRVAFIFKVFDQDGDGLLSEEELRVVLHASVEESTADLPQSEVESLTQNLMQLFDAQDGKLTLPEFERVLTTYPDVLEGFSLEGVITGTRKERQSRPPRPKKSRFPLLHWMAHNPQLTFTYTFFYLAVLACFFWRFSRYAHKCEGVNLGQPDPNTYLSRTQVRDAWNAIMEASQAATNDSSQNFLAHRISVEDAKYMSFSSKMTKQDPIGCQDSRKRVLLSWTLPVAKGCGQAMKCIFTLILFPVSRNLMTALRTTFLQHIFRFDDAIEFHKVVGYTGFFFAWTHTICHIVDVVRWVQRRRFSRWSWAFPDDDLNDPGSVTNTESFIDLKAQIDEIREITKNNGSSLALLNNLVVKAEDDDGPPGFVDDDDENILRLPDDQAQEILTKAMTRDGDFDVYQTTDQILQNEQIFKSGVPRYLFRDRSSQPTVWELLGSWFGVTGVILIVIYTIAAIFAFDYPRKLAMFREKPGERGKKVPGMRGMVLRLGRFLNNFNNFWYTHHLFALFYVAMLLHPVPDSPGERYEWNVSDAYLWIMVPVLIYLGERINRALGTRRNTRVMAADLFPGNVVGLKVMKPPRFRYKAGQYVFIQVPEISWFEWHPFTMTSSPGDNFISVHIRAAGDWTRELHKRTQEYHKSKGAQNIEDGLTAITRVAIRPVAGGTEYVQERFPFRVFVDGPFGAPAQDHTQYSVMILVGAGIGVTPMASVLNDLLDKMRQYRCQRCGATSDAFKVKQVYFYWTVRLRMESIWFKHLLEAISEEDTDNLLEINIHVTSIRKANDVRVMLLRLAQKAKADQEGGDAVSTLKTRAITHFGRPNWDEVFTNVKRTHPEESSIGVFYCGPNPLAKVLAAQVKKHSDQRVTFDFMKESFG